MSKIIDLTGQKFNMLTIIKYTDKRDAANHILWKCLCDCGNICYKNGTDLKRGKIYSCGCTRKPRKKETKPRNINKKETSQRLVGQRFGRLVVLEGTDDRDNNRNIIWKCLCDCGNICYISTRDLGRDTFSCGCLQKETRKNNGLKIMPAKDITNQIFGKLIALYQAYKKNGTYFWHCKCECGNEIDVRIDKLTQGLTLSCGCLNMSRGEAKINNILLNNNIVFEQEKTFEMCRFLDTDALARFDFYINNQYLIEYDGEQHFKYNNNNFWNTKEYFIKTQEHDKFKNQWCKENRNTSYSYSLY